mmetsp:Transcript_26525/g.37013  ORF Transcript_26525/g.37013 Transcript_26525/m.37013 type:complete len:481 (-) Transcript_26525:224-1666(-)
MKKLSRDPSSLSILSGSSKFAPGESKIDAIRHVLSFLKENGFERARKELERESGVKSTDSTTDMSGYLLSAITVYREFLSSKDDSKQDLKAAEERKFEEELVNPKGGPLKPVSKPRISQACHLSNIIDVRFCVHEELQHIVSSVDVRGDINLTQISTGKSIVALSGGMSIFKAPVLSMDFNPKNNLLAVGCMNGGHHVLDVELPNCSKEEDGIFKEGGKNVLEKKPTIISNFSKHGKYVNRVRWNSTGNLLATCSYDQEVRLYSVDEKKHHQQQRQQQQNKSSTGEGGGKGKEKENTEGSCCCLLERFTFRRGVECVEWGRGANAHILYVSLQSDNYIHTIDSKTMKKGQRFNMNSFGDDHVSFSALDLNSSVDGKYLLVATDKDRAIMFASGTEKQVRNFYGAESGQYFNPRAVFNTNQSIAYGSSYDNTIVAWDVASQRVISKLSGHKKMIRSLHVHPRSNILASGSYDKTVRIWEPL